MPDPTDQLAERIRLVIVRDADGYLLFATTDKASALLLMEPGDVMTEEEAWIHV